MSFIKNVMIVLSVYQISYGSDVVVSQTFTSARPAVCYTLLSYGYLNSARKAKKAWLNLTPEKKESLVCCKPCTKESLYSSMFREKIFAKDLHDCHSTMIKGKDFVLMGHSRGSEMAFHYIGQYNPDNLKAAVLFATPVSVIDAVKDKVWSINKVSPKTQKSLLKIKNKSLPIILFHQKNDKLVSYKHSELLYKFLKSHGFKEVYLVPLTSGAHRHLTDEFGYRILQSFYRYYQLPYDPKYATLTDQELLQYKK